MLRITIAIDVLRNLSKLISSTENSKINVKTTPMLFIVYANISGSKVLSDNKRVPLMVSRTRDVYIITLRSLLRAISRELLT